MIFLGFLVLGAVAGFLAGLFGIGGGMVIVPTLAVLLPLAGVPSDLVMSIALGTSFSTIVVTAFSAAQRHHKNGNVDWAVGKYFAPALMVSVFIAGQIVSKLPTAVLSKVFAVMIGYLALKMIFSLKKEEKIKPLTTQSTIVGGSVIGVLASLAGIAGGAFIVPFLTARGIDIKKAIGTSSFCGALLGLAGTLSFIISGWNTPNLPDYSFGFVYLPALVGITVASVFTSKLGANMVSRLPVPTLKKAFAGLLVLVSLKMMFS